MTGLSDPVQTDNNSFQKKTGVQIHSLLIKVIFFILLFVLIGVAARYYANTTYINSDSIADFIFIPILGKANIITCEFNHLLKYPLYGQILKALPLLSAGYLIVWTNLVVTLVLFLIFYLLIMRRIFGGFSVYLFLPYLLFLFSSRFIYSLIAPAFNRNIEIGLALLILIGYDDTRKGRIRSIVEFIVLTALIATDRFWLMVFGGTNVLLFIIRFIRSKTIDRSSVLRLMWVLLSCTCATAILYGITSFYHLRFNPFRFNVSSGYSFLNSTGWIMQGILKAYNLTGSFTWFSIIFALPLVGSSLVGLLILYRTNRAWGEILISFCAVIMGGVIISQRMIDSSGVRYIAPFFFILPIGHMVLLSQIRMTPYKQIIIGIFLIITAMAAWRNSFYLSPQEDYYGSNMRLIRVLEKRGYTYGYTDYWNAPINSYLAENNVSFRQIGCFHSKIKPLDFMSSESWYKPVKGRKTFLIIDRKGPGGLDVKACANADIIHQFGEPLEIIKLSYYGRNLRIYLWNYDIARKMK